MIVVGIETSGAVGSVAVLRDEAVLVEDLFEKGMRHGRELVPRLAAALERAGLGGGAEAVDLLAAGTGPGSYTGLRVGLATAKAIAYARKTPVLGVPSFDALAAGLPADAYAGAAAVVLAFDARRDQVYCGLYRPGEGPCGSRLVREGDFAVRRPAEVLAGVPRPVVLVGDAAALYPDALAPSADEGVTLAPADLAVPRAALVARLALADWRRGRREPAEALAPLYLRPSLPEERREGAA